MYVCMYVCMYVGMYIRTYILHGNYAHICIYMLHACMYIYLRVYVHMFCMNGMI